MERGQPEFTVVVDDLAYKLTLGTKVRTFTQVSYCEVIGQIAGEHGLQHTVTGLDHAAAGLPHAGGQRLRLPQRDRRPLRERLVDRGIGTLVVQPHGTDSTPVTLAARTTCTSFTVRASALHPAEPTVRAGGRRPSSRSARTAATSTSGADANLVQPFLPATNLQSCEQDDQHRGHAARSERGRGSRGSVGGPVDGRARSPRRAPAGRTRGSRRATVTITGAGPASGTYHVTEVEHIYNRRGFETRFTAGDRRPSGLVDVLSGAADVELPPGGPRHRRRHHGRQFEGLRRARSRSTTRRSATRSRATGPGSSPSAPAAQRGMTFLPEVNDEVIVGFEGGDARRPIDPRRRLQRPGRAGRVRRRQRQGQQAADHLPGGTFRGIRRTARDPADQHISSPSPAEQHQVRLGKEKFDATGAGRHADRPSSPAIRRSRSATTGRSPSAARRSPSSRRPTWRSPA